MIGEIALKDAVGVGGFLGLIVLGIGLGLWKLIFRKRYQKKRQKKIGQMEKKGRIEIWLKNGMNLGYSDDMLLDKLKSTEGWSEKDIKNVKKMLPKIRKEVGKDAIQKEKNKKVGNRELPRLAKGREESGEGEETRSKQRRDYETAADNDSPEPRDIPYGTPGRTGRTKGYFS